MILNAMTEKIIERYNNFIIPGIVAIVAIVGITLVFYSTYKTYGISPSQTEFVPEKNLIGQAGASLVNSQSIKDYGLISLNDNVEVYMSSFPSNILSVNPFRRDQKAKLVLLGISQTRPVFSVRAEVFYDDATTNSQWVIKNVTYSGIPTGYSKPVILTDYSSYYGFNVPFIVVKSGGEDKYRMTWKIIGKATSEVKPILLPRFVSIPWIGSKFGYILKIRNNQTYNSTSLPYGSVTNLQSILDTFTNVIYNMSNGAVKMKYEIKEIYYDIPQSVLKASCAELDETALRMSILESIGIDKSNYRSYYDWLIWSSYNVTASQFACFVAFGSNGVPPSSMCPQCGPAAQIEARFEWMFGWIERLFLHEFGHGITLSDEYLNLNQYCINGSPSNVKIEDIFLPCTQVGAPFYMTMGAMGNLWYDPIERARLGWLKGSQVKLITTSGIYDLYTENNDLTSDPDKPIILQILVNISGKPDYVYVIAFNNEFAMNLATYEEYKEYLANSVRLSGSQLNARQGLSSMSLAQYFYSYNNNIGGELGLYEHTIPVGAEVHLLWDGTDVKIKLISLDGNKAVVQVTFL